MQKNILEVFLSKNGIKPDTVSIENTESGLVCELATESIELKYKNDINSPYKREQFLCYLVNTLNNSELSYFELMIKDQRIGWAFPLNSLDRGENLPKYEEQKWGAIYSHFAIQSLIYDELLFEYANYPNLGASTQFTLGDFYSNDMAVVILSKEAIAEIQPQSIRIMLMQHGYLPTIENQEKLSLFYHLNHNYPEPNQKLKISSIADSISENHFDNLERLIINSLQERNTFACFLTLYQVLEHLSLQVFNTCVEVLKVSDLSQNPWMLKEKLVEVTSEKTRLKFLFDSFVKKTINHSLKIELEERCIDYLKEHKLLKEEKTKKHFIDSLYLVRNSIVHRQMELTAKAQEDLHPINDNLYSLCFYLLENVDIDEGKRKIQEKYAIEEAQ